MNLIDSAEIGMGKNVLILSIGFMPGSKLGSGGNEWIRSTSQEINCTVAFVMAIVAISMTPHHW